MEKKVINRGQDYTSSMPIFRDVVVRTGIKAGENLTFSGCAGACYAMACYFAFSIRDLNLNLYFAPHAELGQLRRLKFIEGVGMAAAERVKPVKARVVVLMSGLCRVPYEDVLKFSREALDAGGIIIGQSVVPGMYEDKGWDKDIPFRFLFEYSIKDPTSFEVLK